MESTVEINRARIPVFVDSAVPFRQFSLMNIISLAYSNGELDVTNYNWISQVTLPVYADNSPTEVFPPSFLLSTGLVSEVVACPETSMPKC